MATLRALARLVALAAALAVALLLHGIWRLFGMRSPWPPRLLASVAWLCGARVEVSGRLVDGRVVLLANHLSWLDIPLLAGATGTVFVAKGELARVPLIGWLCGLHRTIFVARGERMAVAAQVAQLRDALSGAEAGPVAIFPEGTTGDGVTLLPFKPALLAALDPPPPGLTVQPVRIDYGAAARALAWVGDEHGAHHAWRVLRRREPFTARLTFAEPFVPAGGRKEVAAEARRRIERVR